MPSQMPFITKLKTAGDASTIVEIRCSKVSYDFFFTLSILFFTLKACQRTLCGLIVLLHRMNRRIILLLDLLLGQDILTQSVLGRHRSLGSFSQRAALKKVTVLSNDLYPCILPSSLVFQRVRSGPGQKLRQKMDLRLWHLEFRPQHLPSSSLVTDCRPRQLLFDINHRLLSTELQTHLTLQLISQSSSGVDDLPLPLLQ